MIRGFDTAFGTNWGKVESVEKVILPDDVIREIFLKLDFKELQKFSLASKQWANDIDLTKKIIFDRFCTSVWNHFCTDKELKKAFHLLPNKISEILKSPCPVFPDSRIMDNHVLAWIPESINGKESSIWNLRQLNEQVGTLLLNGTNCFNFSDISKPIKSGWVFMTKKIIPNSLDKTYTQNEILVENLQHGYRIPTLSEINICIINEYLRSKNHLFHDSVTYAYSLERRDNYFSITGNFPPLSFIIHKDQARYNIGVVAIRDLK